MRKSWALLIVPSILVLSLTWLFFVSAIFDDDIPSTLTECYALLDATLSDEEVDQIRNAGNGELFRSGGLTDDRWNELIALGIDPVDLDLGMTHLGLGLWIRNNWIYRSHSTNIARRFLLSGVNHPDEMSSMVIDGYYLYLNNLPYSIPIQIRAIVAYLIIILILVSSLSFFFMRKSHKSMKSETS